MVDFSPKSDGHLEITLLLFSNCGNTMLTTPCIGCEIVKHFLPVALVLSLAFSSCVSATPPPEPTAAPTETHIPTTTVTATSTATETPIPYYFPTSLESQKEVLGQNGFTFETVDTGESAVTFVDKDDIKAEVIKFNPDGSAVIPGLDSNFKMLFTTDEKTGVTRTDNRPETEFSADLVEGFRFSTAPLTKDGKTVYDIFIEQVNTEGQYVKVARYSPEAGEWQERYSETIENKDNDGKVLKSKTYNGWVVESEAIEIVSKDDPGKTNPNVEVVPIHGSFLKLNRVDEDGGVVATDFGNLETVQVVELENGKDGSERQTEKMVFVGVRYFYAKGGSFVIESKLEYQNYVKSKAYMGKRISPNFITPKDGKFTDKYKQFIINGFGWSPDDFLFQLSLGDDNPFLTPVEVARMVRSPEVGSVVDMRFFANSYVSVEN